MPGGHDQHQGEELFKVSVAAATVAFVSGSTTVLGYNLSVFPERKLEDHGKAALGGGLLFLGLYLVAPSAVRKAWLTC